MTGKEAEALGFLGKEHLAEVAVAETNLTVVGNGAGNAEGLESLTDCSCCIGSLYATLFECDCAADSVCPDSVFKTDGLSASYNFVNINSFCKGDVLTLFN